MRNLSITTVIGWVFVAGLVGQPTRAVADGFIVIEDALELRPRAHHLGRWSRHMPLEVKNHHVTCSIHDNHGTTRIEQVFHNPYPRQLEGTYMFPLPETASVQAFSMWMDGKEVHGEVLGAKKARETYEDIVRKMKDPALLEYMGSRLYRARVFPIPANGDVKIALEYSETISVDDGLAAYRYPLNTEKFSAAPIDVVSIVVEIASQVPLKTVYCPSHNADVNRSDNCHARVGFEAKHVRPDTDFVVYYQMSEKAFGLSLLSFRPPGEDGFFMARIAPPYERAETVIVPKDIAFVLDTSGSMAGEKIEQAKRAMRYCLANLRAEDRFNVINFATEQHPFRDRLVRASKENVEAAIAAVDAFKAAGGTNIHEALMTAIESRPAGEHDRPYMIVFITDGEPTVGERDPQTIQAAVHKANRSGARLFVFGVGHDLNTKLLDRLADDNGGTREYINEKEDIEVKVSSFFRKVSDPVLSDVTLDFAGADVEQLYPKQLPDVFHGSELVVVGRYKDPGTYTVTIRGRRAGDEPAWEYRADFADKRTDADFLPRLWATRKIGYLLDEIRLHGESSEVKDEIVRLAKRYAIVTPYTSYLVVEDERRERVAGRGRDADGDGMIRWGAAYRESEVVGRQLVVAGNTEGLSAVDASVASKELREAPTVLDAPAALSVGAATRPRADHGVAHDAGRFAGDSAVAEGTIRYVGDKTFYFMNGRWVDSQFNDKQKPEPVTLFSDAYFALLTRHPGIGPCLALGDHVIVVWEGTAYEIKA
jgi:Ca-activated chloride channel family protein